MVSGKTLMVPRQPDMDQHGLIQTVSEKTTTREMLKLKELSMMRISLKLDGEPIHQLQSMAQQLLNQLSKLDILTANSPLGTTTNHNQTLRSRSGRSQHFMNTHTTIHSLVLPTTLMDQEPSRMEELLPLNL